MNINTDGQIIRKEATDYDGYTAGQLIERDGTKVKNDKRGMVTSASVVKVTTGKHQKGFEWAALDLLENHADEGENVARYMQANKHGTGPTWGACVELCDTEGLAGRGVGLEVDHWTTGPSREADAPRFGLDVLVGDARWKRKLPHTGVAEVDYGGRLDCAAETPWARFRFGWLVRAFTNAGLVLDSIATRGIAFYGKYVVAIDASGTECQTVLRMSAGQRITFDVYDGMGVSQKDGFLVFDQSGTPLLKIDVRTGATHIFGDLHLTGKLIQTKKEAK